MMKKFFGIFILFLLIQISFAQKLTDPQLISPSNEMYNAMPDVTLDWSAVSGIGEITYHIQLAKDANFTDLVVDEDGLDITAYYNEYLLFGQEYFWRVKAHDEDGSTDWSAPYSFSIFSTVELDEPDGDDEITLRPIFEIKNEVEGEDDDITISGVDYFRIEIDTTEDFNSPMLISELAPAILDGKVYVFAPDYIDFGTYFYWRAKPANENSEGEFDEVFEFETLFTVELEEPGDGDDEIEFDQVIEWEDLIVNKKPAEYPYNIDIYNYTLEISTDENFTEPIIYALDSNTIELDILKFNTEYYWRARGIHVNDTSIWSEVYSFSTVATVQLDSPENGAITTNTRPTLTWEGLAKVQGYEILLSTNEDLSEAESFVTDGKTPSLPLTELDLGTTYYWAVRAYNGTDYSLWSETYSFYVSATGINEISSIHSINVHPVPANDFINLSFEMKETSPLNIAVVDMVGKIIFEESMIVETGKVNRTIDVSELNNGVYFVEIAKEDQKQVVKFVVE